MLLLSLLATAGYATAQIGNANFNQVININGDMQLNSVTFPDGSRIEAYSQSQRQLLVNQNQAPLPGNQVTGSTGNPFVQISNTSLIIQTNGATDLVGAQIELPMTQNVLSAKGISPENTYVAKLSPDRQSWMVMEDNKSVNTTDSTVRMVKLNLIDGEYILLGRATREANVALTPFGTTVQSAFNVTGSGLQENEYTDGFRLSVRSSEPLTITTNVVNGISSTMLAALGAGVESVNNYRYVVGTNLAGVLPNIDRIISVVQVPINAVRLQTIAQNLGANPNSTIKLAIAQRGVQDNPGGAFTIGRRQVAAGGSPTANNPAATKLLLSPTFTPINSKLVLDATENRLAIAVPQIDGEYILTVQLVGASGAGAAAGSNGTLGSAPPAANAPAAAAAPPAVAASAAPSPSPAAPQGPASAPTSAAAVAPAVVPSISISVPAASPPPAVAAAPTGGVPVGRFYRRQLAPLAAPASSAASSTPAAAVSSGLEVSMSWVIAQANVQRQGLAVNVGAMMAEYAASNMEQSSGYPLV